MKKLTVEKAVEISAPVSKVWAVLTRPEFIRQWFYVPADFPEGDAELHSGSKILWTDSAGEVYLEGTVTAFNPEKSFTTSLHDRSWKRPVKTGEVAYTYTLVPQEHGVVLSFVFGDLSVDPEGEQWRKAYQENDELQKIKELAEQLK